DITEIHGGTVFLNMDDPIIKRHSRNYWNKITYGFNGSVNVKGKIINYTNDGRTKIKISYEGKKIETTLPVYGESNAKNYLAASAVALKLGLTGKEILNGTKNIKPVLGRLEIKKFKDAVVIDDTYNSSPASVESAVDLIKKIKTHKRKIIVLGDMFELGKQSEKLHKELAKLFSPDKNLFVLTTGNMMKHLNKALRKKKVKSIHFHIREALSLYLQYEEIENSVILVKGSRGMKMEEFVNALEKRFE
ncbi:MAG: cyanophycin synthetase, partial [Bacteroidota bacterium]